ncbi:MAG: acyl-CoA dehydrogenase family protein [Candidatus Methanospirareceae archaeon]
MGMDFALSERHKEIAETARGIAEKFGLEYWREKDERGEFPKEYWDALAKEGICGLTIPEEYGGSGEGMLEMAIAIENLAAWGCGFAGAWFLVFPLFARYSIGKYGTKEQKEKYLPKIADGSLELCLAMTEEGAGSNTPNTRTFAEMREGGDEYVINGEKALISGADRAGVMLLIARTTPKEKVKKRTEGLSLFIIDLPNPAVKVELIPKMGTAYHSLCRVKIKDLVVPAENLVGEKDKGFYHLLDLVNPERISCAAGDVGLTELAIRYAAEYAKRRVVFDRPIGEYQIIQFPLAETKAYVEAARLLTYKAAWLFDRGEPCGYEVNAAKYVSAAVAFEATKNAIRTLGGWGYTKEKHAERWFREVQHQIIAPVSQELALAFIGHRVIGLPKSY